MTSHSVPRHQLPRQHHVPHRHVSRPPPGDGVPDAHARPPHPQHRHLVLRRGVGGRRGNRLPVDGHRLRGEVQRRVEPLLAQVAQELRDTVRRD